MGTHPAPRVMPLDSLHLAHEIAGGAGDDLPPGALEWLRTGLARYLAGGAPLDVALGLSGAARMAQRDRALQAAARILDDGRCTTPWELAGELERAVSYFEGQLLMRCRSGATKGLTPLQTCLWHAFRTGATPLRTRESLHKLLR
mgnify:CR=1 FL=1